jgi:DNA invertase Pin-like site-specific DNA recombinase
MALRDGDTLIVWRLDRLGRSLGDLIHLTHEYQARGVGFASLTEQIDTRSPTGQLVFHAFGALAEFERNLIRERTLAGLKATRARGRKGSAERTLFPLSPSDPNWAFRPRSLLRSIICVRCTIPPLTHNIDKLRCRRTWSMRACSIPGC